MNKSPRLRPDLALICQWIQPGSRILDLGCGDGTLLAYLAEHHNVTGYGLEIDPDNVARCIESGVNVIQADLDDGLREFDSGSFDYVVMTQALQALQRPDEAVTEILRVGRTGIVTFPNFGHWRVRAALGAGRMPVTPNLPHRWYDSPNIHLCTVDDFEDLCAARGWHIVSRHLLNSSHRKGRRARLAPNLLCEQALYLLQAETRPS
ncbi:methionine biosynthesis protein MetW [Sinimarinibacterium sp. NLF-5-8]|nr:methionine biosynthesis protein MetW [Sinimarinibacterium sp. NLF-5-8]QHS10362.1 methionine biosynthesis protein MetW [Sinimarinibacterium sp. NLF-5-8]